MEAFPALLWFHSFFIIGQEIRKKEIVIDNTTPYQNVQDELRGGLSECFNSTVWSSILCDFSPVLSNIRTCGKHLLQNCFDVLIISLTLCIDAFAHGGTYIEKKTNSSL